MKNKMLKILLPTMLPIAISALPLLAATTDVTSSGRDVPSATIVRPINRSLMPNIFASSVAASTVISLPTTISTIPTTPKKSSFGRDPFDSIVSACIWPFLHMTNIYAKYAMKHTHRITPSMKVITLSVYPRNTNNAVIASINGIS